jgi:hypothetical protein
MGIVSSEASDCSARRRVAYAVSTLAVFWLWVEVRGLQDQTSLARVGPSFRITHTSAGLLESLLIAAQLFPVLTVRRWPLASTAIVALGLGATGLAGGQLSLAVAAIPVLLLVATSAAGCAVGLRSAALVAAAWLSAILTVAGPAPAASEYVGVALAVTVPVGVGLLLRRRDHWSSASSARLAGWRPRRGGGLG